jgi:undecaprenyl-diphosphatase
MNLFIFNFLNGLAVDYPALDSTFAFMGNGFTYVAIVILGYFLLTHKDKKRGVQEVLMMVGVAILAWFLAHYFKGVFDTQRPFVAIPGVSQLFPQEADGAFPSGHATFFSALAVMMWFYHRRIALSLGVVAIIVGLGRVISGVHFPIDILGGYVLGFLISVISYFVIQLFLKKRGEKSEN